VRDSIVPPGKLVGGEPFRQAVLRVRDGLPDQASFAFRRERDGRRVLRLRPAPGSLERPAGRRDAGAAEPCAGRPLELVHHRADRAGHRPHVVHLAVPHGPVAMARHAAGQDLDALSSRAHGEAQDLVGANIEDQHRPVLRLVSHWLYDPVPDGGCAQPQNRNSPVSRSRWSTKWRFGESTRYCLCPTTHRTLG